MKKLLLMALATTILISFSFAKVSDYYDYNNEDFLKIYNEGKQIGDAHYMLITTNFYNILKIVDDNINEDSIDFDTERDLNNLGNKIALCQDYINERNYGMVKNLLEEIQLDLDESVLNLSNSSYKKNSDNTIQNNFNFITELCNSEKHYIVSENKPEKKTIAAKTSATPLIQASTSGAYKVIQKHNGSSYQNTFLCGPFLELSHNSDYDLRAYNENNGLIESYWSGSNNKAYETSLQKMDDHNTNACRIFIFGNRKWFYRDSNHNSLGNYWRADSWTPFTKSETMTDTDFQVRNAIVYGNWDGSYWTHLINFISRAYNDGTIVQLSVWEHWGIRETRNLGATDPNDCPFNRSPFNAANEATSLLWGNLYLLSSNSADNFFERTVPGTQLLTNWGNVQYLFETKLINELSSATGSGSNVILEIANEPDGSTDTRRTEWEAFVANHLNNGGNRDWLISCNAINIGTTDYDVTTWKNKYTRDEVPYKSGWENVDIISYHALANASSQFGGDFGGMHVTSTTETSLKNDRLYTKIYSQYPSKACIVSTDGGGLMDNTVPTGNQFSINSAYHLAPIYPSTDGDNRILNSLRAGGRRYGYFYGSSTLMTHEFPRKWAKWTYYNFEGQTATGKPINLGWAHFINHQSYTALDKCIQNLGSGYTNSWINPW